MLYLADNWINKSSSAASLSSLRCFVSALLISTIFSRCTFTTGHTMRQLSAGCLLEWQMFWCKLFSDREECRLQPLHCSIICCAQAVLPAEDRNASQACWSGPTSRHKSSYPPGQTDINPTTSNTSQSTATLCLSPS